MKKRQITKLLTITSRKPGSSLKQWWLNNRILKFHIWLFFTTYQFLDEVQKITVLSVCQTVAMLNFYVSFLISALKQEWGYIDTCYYLCNSKFVMMFVKTESSCSADRRESVDWFLWLNGESGLFGWHVCRRENVKSGWGAASWRSFAYSMQKDSAFAIQRSSEVVAGFARLSGLWWTYSNFQNERQNWELIRKQEKKKNP